MQTSIENGYKNTFKKLKNLTKTNLTFCCVNMYIKLCFCGKPYIRKTRRTRKLWVSANKTSIKSNLQMQFLLAERHLDTGHNIDCNYFFQFVIQVFSLKEKSLKHYKLLRMVTILIEIWVIIFLMFKKTCLSILFLCLHQASLLSLYFFFILLLFFLA